MAQPWSTIFKIQGENIYIKSKGYILFVECQTWQCIQFTNSLISLWHVLLAPLAVLRQIFKGRRNLRTKERRIFSFHFVFVYLYWLYLYMMVTYLGTGVNKMGDTKPPKSLFEDLCFQGTYKSQTNFKPFKTKPCRKVKWIL
jgi:hypothetical protein